jgi:SHS2 domain-containing protein
MYEVFEHTADLGLRVRAPDLPTLFAEAAKALFSLIVDLGEVRPQRHETFRIEGRDRDYLLFDWLNELLFTFETKHLVLADFHVQLHDGGLIAEAEGELLDPQRHRLDHEVKAITYHGLVVREDEDGWLAEVIVDI